MKKFVLKQKEIIELENTEPLPIKDGFCKIRITKAGISESDSFLYYNSDSFPIVLGRQGVGIVSEAKGEQFQKNDRVLISPYLDDNRVMGVSEEGFYRDFALIEEKNLIKLPDQVTDNEAIFCEYISMALEIINRLEFEKGEHIVIVGGNILGNILASLCIYYHAIPVLVENNKKNIEIAKDNGVYFVVSENDNVTKYLHQITGGKMAKYVVHTADNSYAFKDTLSYARKSGKIVISALYPTRMQANLATILENNLQVIGVSGAKGEMRSALNLLATKTIRVDNFITKIAKFKEIPMLLKQYKSDEIAEVVVDCLE